MKRKRVGVAKVAKVTGLAVVPLGLAAVVSIVGRERRHELATQQLLSLALTENSRLTPEEVEALVAQGADVNAANGTGFTLLHNASFYSLGTTRLLLDKGARVNARESDGNTPLMSAVAAGDAGTVRLLLGRGANVHLTRRFKVGGKPYTPLFCARDSLRWNHDPVHVRATTEIIQMLKAAGARE